MAMFGDGYSAGNLGAAQRLSTARNANAPMGGGKSFMGNMGQPLPPPSGYSPQVSNAPEQTQQAFTGAPTGGGGALGQLGTGQDTQPAFTGTPSGGGGQFGQLASQIAQNPQGFAQQYGSQAPDPRRMAGLLRGMRMFR